MACSLKRSADEAGLEADSNIKRIFLGEAAENEPLLIDATSVAVPNTCGAGGDAAIPHLPDEPVKSAPALSTRQKRRKKEYSRVKRLEKRRMAKIDRKINWESLQPFVSKHVINSTPVPSTFSLLDTRSGEAAQSDAAMAPVSKQELLDQGFQYFSWTGGDNLPFTDRDGVLYCVFVWRPDSDSWKKACDEAHDAMEGPRIRGRVTLTRGITCSTDTGPSNHAREDDAQERAEDLTDMQCFQQLSNYASRALVTWAPNLHEYYNTMLNDLCAHNPSITRPFDQSPFAVTQFIPDTASTALKEEGKLDPEPTPTWCAHVALGNYDPTTGGHVVLWDLKALVEFPPGCVVLLPSAALCPERPITTTLGGAGELRRSFTQFTPREVLRWVERGNQGQEEFKSGGGVEVGPEEEWRKDVGRISRWAELVALHASRLGKSEEGAAGGC